MRETWPNMSTPNAIIEPMARDLTIDFRVPGFSVRNLKYIRKFAEVYPDPQFMQALLAQLPWWHNVLLLEKLKDFSMREMVCSRGNKNIGALPKELRGTLPTAAEIEAKLTKHKTEDTLDRDEL